jgi:hypothetical protein
MMNWHRLFHKKGLVVTSDSFSYIVDIYSSLFAKQKPQGYLAFIDYIYDLCGNSLIIVTSLFYRSTNEENNDRR